jgi:hypothetical protein
MQTSISKPSALHSIHYQLLSKWIIWKECIGKGEPRLRPVELFNCSFSICRVDLIPQWSVRHQKIARRRQMISQNFVPHLQASPSLSGSWSKKFICRCDSWVLLKGEIWRWRFEAPNSKLSAPDLGVHVNFNFTCHMKYHSSHLSLIVLGCCMYQLHIFLLDSCRSYFRSTESIS